MHVVLRVIAWIIGLTLAGAVLYGVWLGVREPLREWKAGRRRDAALLGVAVRTIRSAADSIYDNNLDSARSEFGLISAQAHSNLKQCDGSTSFSARTR